MRSHVSPPVTRALNNVLSVLGSSFSLNQLASYTESWRQKTMRIETDTMPIGMTGYCVALLDLDLVCVRTDLDPVLKLISILHELAHFLLGHIYLLPKGENTPRYALFVQRRDQEPLTYRKRFYDPLYNTDREHDAESLATLLLECIQQYERNLPDIIRNLHG